MPRTTDITADRLRERLELRDGGRLFWRNCPDMPLKWRSNWAGREAFTAVDGKGYHHGTVDYVCLRKHRVVWALCYGSWPEGQLDHIDGDRRNNTPSNLRVVTGSENHRNTKRPKHNTSGVAGVGWYKPYGKWRAYIAAEGRKHVHLGFFATKEEAVDARRAAEIKYGYHSNHGRAV